MSLQPTYPGCTSFNKIEDSIQAIHMICLYERKGKFPIQVFRKPSGLLAHLVLYPTWYLCRRGRPAAIIDSESRWGGRRPAAPSRRRATKATLGWMLPPTKHGIRGAPEIPGRLSPLIPRFNLSPPAFPRRLPLGRGSRRLLAE
jgi:hypothetical protein